MNNVTKNGILIRCFVTSLPRYFAASLFYFANLGLRYLFALLLRYFAASLPRCFGALLYLIFAVSLFLLFHSFVVLSFSCFLASRLPYVAASLFRCLVVLVKYHTYGKQIPLADTLSRIFLKDDPKIPRNDLEDGVLVYETLTQSDLSEEVEVFEILYTVFSDARMEKIRTAMKQDQTMQIQ